MIAERLARKARAALAELAASASSARETPAERAATFRKLGAEALSIGLFDLGERLEQIARSLEDPTDHHALAEALLASYDRVEALSAALARRALARAFGASEDEP